MTSHQMIVQYINILYIIVYCKYTYIYTSIFGKSCQMSGGCRFLKKSYPIDLSTCPSQKVPAHEPEAAVADAHWQVDDRDGAWAVFQTGKFCPKNWDFGA